MCSIPYAVTSSDHISFIRWFVGLETNYASVQWKKNKATSHWIGFSIDLVDPKQAEFNLMLI